MGQSVYNWTNTGYGASAIEGQVSNGYCSINRQGSQGSNISFKVGGDYPNITCRTSEGINFIKNGLGSIDVSPYIEGRAFYPRYKEVGSPYVVEGILSGVDSNNYLTLLEDFNGSGATSWEIVFNIYLNSNVLVTETLLGRSGSSSMEPVIGITEGNYLIMKLSNESDWIVNLVGTTPLVVNVWYWVKFEFTGTQYKISYSTDNVSYTLDNSVDTTVKFTDKSLSFIGYGQNTFTNTKYPYYSLIDLSNSWIKKDNNIWWNCIENTPHGEYTIYVPEEGGAYLIKDILYRQPNIPSNYSVRKYAQVSKDFVASNFKSGDSNTGGILTNEPFNPSNNSWEIEIKHKTGSDVNTAQSLTGCSSPTENVPHPVIQIDSSKYKLWLSSNTSTYDIANGVYGTHIISPNSTGRVKIGYDGGSHYYLKYTLEEWRNTAYSTSLSNSEVVSSINVAVALQNNVNSDDYMYSTDGLNWTTRQFPDQQPYAWNKVAYLNGVFLVYRNSNCHKLLYSTDALHWICQESLPISGNWIDVAYGNGKYIMIQPNSNNVIYSEDGLAWNIGTIKELIITRDALGNVIEHYNDLTETFAWESITYGDGLFILTCADSNTYFYSNDGIGWVRSEFPSSADTINSGYKVVYGNGKFVAFQYKSDSYNANTVFYSNDGIQWSIANVTAQRPEKVHFFGNRFYSLSNTGSSYISLTSKDGEFWEERNLTTGSWADTAYINNKYVTLPQSSGTIVAIEPDTWTEDISITSSAKIYPHSEVTAFGNYFYDYSNLSPYLGQIYLKDTKMLINGVITWKYLPDSFIWEDTSCFPTTIRRYRNNEMEVFNDVPLGRVIITPEGITLAETFDYNNKYVTVPNATRPADVVKTYRHGDSWMKVYADRWVEMGGLIRIPTKNTNTSVVLLGETMADNQYHVEALGLGGYDLVCTSRTNTYFVLSSAVDNNPVSWYVSGYLQ